jgi:hypothetical protein
MFFAWDSGKYARLGGDTAFLMSAQRVCSA